MHPRCSISYIDVDAIHLIISHTFNHFAYVRGSLLIFSPLLLIFLIRAIEKSKA